MAEAAAGVIGNRLFSGMVKKLDQLSLELALLFACSRVRASEQDVLAIREILGKGEIDWTVFANKAVEHGLAPISGHMLSRASSDLIPQELLDAFRINLEQTRERNRVLLFELSRIIDALRQNGITAIPLKGPVLALQAYGDIGLRVFRDLDFLVRDGEMAATIKVLSALGYDREEKLTDAQVELIQRLQGQEILFKRRSGIAVEPHTHLTSAKMAFDIDYPGLWRRARQVQFESRTMLILQPEDTLIVLAIHGGKEMWWNLKWACDVAAFVQSNPSLDWASILDRSAAQGCLRIVLLAAALVQEFFRIELPQHVTEAARSDAAIQSMLRELAVHWQQGDAMEPPSNKTVSLRRIQLHDGWRRRALYVGRTLLLPGPHHVTAMPMPKRLNAAYVPLKVAHDLVALPLWRLWRTIVRVS